MIKINIEKNDYYDVYYIINLGTKEVIARCDDIEEVEQRLSALADSNDGKNIGDYVEVVQAIGWKQA